MDKLKNIKIDKKKYINIALIFICIISVILIGTYALKLWSSTENTELTFRIGEYTTESLICKSSEDITISNIGPVFNYTKDGEIIPFKVLASSDNTSALNVNFNISTITDNLKVSSFKYVLMSSKDNNTFEELIKGDFSNTSNNTQIPLISNNILKETTYYKLIIYIDGNMKNPISMQNGSITGNIEVCSKEKFNVTLNVTNGTSDNNTLKVVSGDNAIFTITPNDGYVLDIESQTCEGTLDSNTGIYTINNITENKECNLTLKLGNLDDSGANYPDLVDGLIPVVYNESTSNWVKADTETSKAWYDYDNKKWANAVLVTEKNRATYQSATPGTTIAESDILAYYVWIPRYKYKVWNINKVVGTDSYNARTTGIDIVFESEKDKTGTVSCTYSYNSPSSSANSPNESCTGSNGNYYTHPAFTFGSDEVRGFWIGKYEISSSNQTGLLSYGGGNTTSLTVRILPNVTSWRYNTVSNYNTVIQNMQTSSNIYGLSTSKTNTDSHMLTNYEWGAVAYLTNSKYGRCTNGSCTEVTINGYGETSYYKTKTGCGPISSGSTSYGTTCNAYNTTLGQLASTTGNIFGVYDMSGGADEFVMGNISSASGSYTFYPSSSGFASGWYTTSTAKYVTTYANGSSYRDQTAYNRGRLGDATGEVVLSTGGASGWYSDYAVFPSSNVSWFIRGGCFDSGTSAGVFSFYRDGGGSDYGSSSRAALVSLSS